MRRRTGRPYTAASPCGSTRPSPFRDSSAFSPGVAPGLVPTAEAEIPRSSPTRGDSTADLRLLRPREKAPPRGQRGSAFRESPGLTRQRLRLAVFLVFFLTVFRFAVAFFALAFFLAGARFTFFFFAFAFGAAPFFDVTLTFALPLAFGLAAVVLGFLARAAGLAASMAAWAAASLAMGTRNGLHET